MKFCMPKSLQVKSKETQELVNNTTAAVTTSNDSDHLSCQ